MVSLYKSLKQESFEGKDKGRDKHQRKSDFPTREL